MSERGPAVETDDERRWRDFLEGAPWPGRAVHLVRSGACCRRAGVHPLDALRPDVTPTARLLAAGAGVAAAIATFHLYAKQVYLFDLYEGVIEGERRRLGQPGLQLDELRERPIPERTSYRRRRWREEGRWRNRLIGRKVAITWLVTLTVFVGIDFFLLVYALLGLSGADPGWLGPGPLSPE